MSNEFYVYVHRRGDNNEVFYVGKGKGRRAYNKAGRNNYWCNIVNKHGYIIEIVENGLSEESAFDLEKELIKFYRDNGHKLTNLTDGGEGGTGCKRTDAEKQRLRQIWKERVLPETCQPFDCSLKLNPSDSGKIRYLIKFCDRESVRAILANLKLYGKVSIASLRDKKSKISWDRIKRAAKYLESIGCLTIFMAPTGTRLNGVYSYLESVNDKSQIVELFKSLVCVEGFKISCRTDGKYRRNDSSGRNIHKPLHDSEKLIKRKVKQPVSQ